MTFQNYAINNAYQLGAYKSIAGMMAERIRQLDTAEADSIEAEFAMRNLVSLAQQFEETVEKFKESA